MATPRLDTYAARRAAAGWTPKAIAAAAGVSLRAAYRYRDITAVQTVRVGDQEADFAIWKVGPPSRVSEWRPV